VILAKRARALRKKTSRPIYALSECDKSPLLDRLKVSFGRPTKVLPTESVVASFTLCISYAWGILFLSFSSVVTTYQTAYNFSIFQTGLVELAITVGAVIGTAVNPAADELYSRSTARNREIKGKPIPEARLYTAVPGSLLFTSGLFWFGKA